MKFDRPDDDYYRREIGRKLERACLFDSDIEDPSPETVKMWMEKAKELREKRRRRKRLLISSAAVFVLSVGIGATIAFEQPSAEAGNSGEVRIETGMESKDTYASVDEVPDSVKEEFLMFPEMPEGYELEEITVSKTQDFQMVSFNYLNNIEADSNIYITEIISEDEAMSNIVNSNTKKELWGDIEVYISKYESGDEEIVYKFIYNKMIITLYTPNEIGKTLIQRIIKEAVQI
ncbi:MAG: hypothetical protein UIJ88_01735 [Anaerovoracaceae bacterium]|nr:hypothetical protein [Anaerovoracaceae bacterium]